MTIITEISEAIKMNAHNVRAFIKQRELLAVQVKILKKTPADGCPDSQAL